MNYKEIRELTEWLEKSSFTAYSLSINGVHLSVSKQQVVQQPYMEQPLGNSVSFTQVKAEQASSTITTQSDSGDLQAHAEEHIISSPIVGVYYESINPKSLPFVQVGQSVKTGDILCILEAMKVMNEITSDVDGVIAEIFVANGDMVEACMPLFRIETK